MEKKIRSRRISKNNFEISSLTPAEILIVWRRRKQWNQKKAAEHYGISHFNYAVAECGKIRKVKLKIPNISPLHDHEKCFILRKRTGKTQEEIAANLGCGKYWLRLQEVGKVSCKKLLTYWMTQATK